MGVVFSSTLAYATHGRPRCDRARRLGDRKRGRHGDGRRRADRGVRHARRNGGFENPGWGLAPTDDPRAFEGDGTRWSGATGESDDGRALARVPTPRLFAFAWQDDHGPDAFYGG